MSFRGININQPGIIGSIFLVTITLSCASNNQLRPKMANTHNSNDSILVDRDGNRYALKTFLDNKLWMTTNLELNIPGSFCYDNSGENCEKYGRLYEWEAAQKGCRLLGEGWRLPVYEDWQQLAHIYGAFAEDSVEYRKRAFQSLLYTGTSQFNAITGGGRAPGGQYTRLEAHGFYWTATGHDSTAWFANFAKGSQSLYLQSDGEKTRAFSVRCINYVDTLRH